MSSEKKKFFDDLLKLVITFLHKVFPEYFERKKKSKSRRSYFHKHIIDVMIRNNLIFNIALIYFFFFVCSNLGESCGKETS